MNITIDIGNSRIKVTSFENNVTGSAKIVSGSLSPEWIYKNYPPAIDSVIVSSVRKSLPGGITGLKKICKKFIILNEKTRIPLINKYSTPGTLGPDRLAAAIGANYLFPGTDCLVIDAGTAITYDMITESGEYNGGAISPGIHMRFSSLAKGSQKLPHLDKIIQTSYPGDNTVSSVMNGVMLGVFFEAQGYINLLRDKFPKLQVIVTGGDYLYFEKRFKSAIFAEPDLVAIGLNRIIEYNV